MAVVQISGSNWSQTTGKRGPFQDSNGDLWLVFMTLTGQYLRAAKSSDVGASWNTNYDSTASISGLVDVVWDGSDIIYALVIQSTVLNIYSFTISTQTWARKDTGTGPTIGTDGLGAHPAYLIYRSTGDFVVFFQGTTHSLMGTPYRACRYAICSSAGVWSSAVEVSGAVKLHHYDCKSACLGASNRSHFYYTDGPGINSPGTHRSLSSANAFGETPGQNVVTDDSSWSYSIYYDSILGKVVLSGGATSQVILRADSAAGPTWINDSSSPAAELASSAPAFIYEPTDEKLYIFSRDAMSDDLYRNENQKGDISIEPQGINALNSWAQDFTPTRNYNLSIIGLYLSKSGSPGDLGLEIRLGGPTGSVIATGSVSASAVGTSKAWVPGIFADPPALVSGTKYCLVFTTNSSSYDSQRTSSDVYPGNSAWWQGAEQPGTDMALRIPGGTIWGRPEIQSGAVAAQEYYTGNGTDTQIYGGTGIQERIGQTFKLSKAISVDKIRLWVRRLASPSDNLYLDICADSSGSPGSVIATSNALPAVELTTAGQGKNFIFASPPSLSVNTTYWMVLRRDGARDNTNFFEIYGYAATGGYADGAGYHRDNGSWVANGTVYDWYFQIPPGYTIAGISVGLITNGIGITFLEPVGNIFFDKLLLAPPEPILGQTHFRFRNDNGDESAASWKDDLDASISLSPNDQYRLRFAIEESNGAEVSASDYRLKCSVNGGAYNDIPGNAAPAASSSQFTGPVSTTQQISSGSFGTGKLVELGTDSVKYPVNLSIPANGVTEIEFTLVIPAGQSIDDTLDFRIYDQDNNPLGSYSNTPRITVVAAVTWVEIAGPDYPFYLEEETLMRWGAEGYGWLEETIAAGNHYANLDTFSEDPAPGQPKTAFVPDDSLAALYWYANFETNAFDQHWWIRHWSGSGGQNTVAEVGYSAATIVSNPVHEGVYAAKFQCDPTSDSGTSSDRCELFSTKWASAGFEGNECWYRWASYLPGPSQEWWPTGAGWNSLMQLAPQNEAWMGVGVDAVNIPHLVFNYGANRIDLTNDLIYNHWYVFEAHIIWSDDDQIGLLEITLDGNQKLSTNFETLEPGYSSNHISLGLYRAPWDHTNTVIHDGFVRSLVPLPPLRMSQQEEFFAFL